jgi:anaerobic selenocysteine-containing dehydrogenase
MLLLSSHLETGHYFNPHAQRIIEAKSKGAKLAVVDVRLSNTASMADYWMAPWPGTEAMLLLAMAHVLLEENLFDREFVETWVNWREFLSALDAGKLDASMLGVSPASMRSNHEASERAQLDRSSESSANASLDRSGERSDRQDRSTSRSEHTPRDRSSAAGDSTQRDRSASPRSDDSSRESKRELTFDRFLRELKRIYAFATPEAAEKECGVAKETIIEVARGIGAAKRAFASHVWRNAASGNLGGWQVARCLEFLCVLTGSVGAKGGTNLNSQDKFVPPPFLKPPPQNVWNELLYPREYPLAHHELSYLLPHMLLEGRGKIAAYFTRVYNPVWTNPDGMVWEQVLRDEAKIELHAALTPTWSETAQYADYVLPVGHGAERHDLMSQETHAAKWISFRQPVQRVMRERLGEKLESTRDANPGEVWEEDEFWIALSWRIDPDGSLGIRKYYESPYRKGERITVDEYYGWIFENSVPGLPEEAKKKGMTPLEYMRRHGAFLVAQDTYEGHLKKLAQSELDGASIEATTDTVLKNGKPIGVFARVAQRSGASESRASSSESRASSSERRGSSSDDRNTSSEGRGNTIEADAGNASREAGRTAIAGSDLTAVSGFATPSRRLEIFSQTMIDWGWPEHALPGYIESHVHRRHLDAAKGEYALIPTFRLPTLIHTRSGNAKWLYELSNANPVWIHPEDAEKIGVETTDLVRISTRIGHFVNKAWVTEGMRPGVVACSHHLGRWRLFDDTGADKWASSKVMREEIAPGRYRFRRLESIHPFASSDPDSKRIWWTDGGVHQNLTFPVQPDPISGMHCWHQRVRVERAKDGDRYGDVEVDTQKSMEIYREWLALTRKEPRPGGVRRPLHFARAVRPSAEAYRT